jgi:type VI secretion system protein ImpA
MIDVETLLAPISEASPCGEDLSYDPDLQELETLIQGKAETQFSAAEEPNWKDMHKRCLALFGRTKDLRVTLDLNLTLLQQDGFPGFAQGLELLRGLLERYWEPLYPRMDPEEGNDPLERMNIIASLAVPESTFGDPLRFVSRLRSAPLCRSPRMGAFSLAQIVQALGGEAPAATESADGKPAPPPPDLSAIEAAFQDSSPEFIQTQRAALEGALVSMEAIDEFLTGAVGSGSAPNLEALKNTLTEAKQRFEAYAPSPGAAGGDADASAAVGDSDSPAAAAAPSARAGSRSPGSIGSREDVVKALEAICAFYKTNEPSSPVPTLLEHAKKLVGRNFLEILQALSPEATPQVKLTPDAPVVSE